MQKTCEECKNVFHGRSDARFCSSDCRSTFHNRKNYHDNKLKREVNKVLWSNRQILKEINPEGKINVPKTKLQERGFNFKYFTNEYRTKSGNLYKFCYDYGYMESRNDYLTIVQRQEYVD